MKPIIKYRGGKFREIPHLIYHVPRFSGRYIEPFLGGGAMFFHLEPREAVLCDINERLIDFYRGIRDDFNRVRAELDFLSELYAAHREDFEMRKSIANGGRVEDENEHLYYRLREQFNQLSPTEYTAATLYYYINKTAYSGMIRYNTNGEFNVPFGRYTRLGTENVSYKHAQLLGRAELLCGDYRLALEKATKDDFIFLDPPYDCTFSDYGNALYRDGFTEDEHRRLAEDFRQLPCPAMMVIGRTPLTEELYGDYVIDQYTKNYAVNIRNRFKSMAEHIVVANYRKSELDISVLSQLVQGEVIEPLLFEKTACYGKN